LLFHWISSPDLLIIDLLAWQHDIYGAAVKEP